MYHQGIKFGTPNFSSHYLTSPLKMSMINQYHSGGANCELSNQICSLVVNMTNRLKESRMYHKVAVGQYGTSWGYLEQLGGVNWNEMGQFGTYLPLVNIININIINMSSILLLNGSISNIIYFFFSHFNAFALLFSSAFNFLS